MFYVAEVKSRIITRDPITKSNQSTDSPGTRQQFNSSSIYRQGVGMAHQWREMH